jgi:hypothetical protein
MSDKPLSAYGNPSSAGFKPESAYNKPLSAYCKALLAQFPARGVGKKRPYNTAHCTATEGIRAYAFILGKHG